MIKCIAGILLLLLVSPVYAADWYISQSTGTDDGSCGSSESPCKTISYTWENRASSGDTFYLKRGDTWTDTDEGKGADEWINFSSDTLTFDAYGTGSDPIVSRWDETGSPDYREVVYGSGTFNASNIYFRGAKDSRILYGTLTLTIDSCTFDGNGFAAESLIRTTGSNCTISNCTVDLANGSTRYDKFVEFGASGSNAHDNTVSNTTIQGIAGTGSIRFLYQTSGTNTIDSCYFWGNISKQESYGTAWAITVRDQSNTKTIVKNCIFDLSASTSLTGNYVAAYAMWNGGGTLKFHNNTIVGGNTAGTVIYPAGSGYTVYAYNNIIYDCYAGFWNAGSGFWLYNNAYYSTTYEVDSEGGEHTSGNLSNQSSAQIALTDPTFSGNDAEDAQIESGSVCINAGTTETDTPSDDYWGIARSTIDIGAHEYGSSFSQIQGLTIRGGTIQ